MIDHPTEYRPEPLHRSWLITACICFGFLLFILISAIATSSPYLYPPGWLSDCADFAFIPVFVAIFCVFRTLLAIRYCARSRIHRLVIAAIALLCACSPLLYYLAGSSLNHRVSPLRSYMSANARGIAQSAIVYSNDNTNHFPPSMAEMVLRGQISPKQIINPLESEPCVLPSPPQSATPAITAEIERTSGFIYTAADLVVGTDLSSEIIVLYSKPSPYLPDGRIIAFADGHAEHIRPNDLPAVFSASNTARTKLHLPPFTLDGPPPMPPTN